MKARAPKERTSFHHTVVVHETYEEQGAPTETRELRFYAYQRVSGRGSVAEVRLTELIGESENHVMSMELSPQQCELLITVLDMARKAAD